MKLNTVVLFLFILSTVGGVMAAGKTVSVTVGHGVSLVKTGEKSFFFDYGAGYLYAFNEEDCTEFPLHAPDEIEPFFNSIEIDDTGEIEVKDGVELLVKKIFFGKSVLPFRTVTSPVLKRYGVDFSPRTVTCFIQQGDDSMYYSLLRVVKHNEPYYQKYPLLRQLDPAGLLILLQGVPLVCRDGNGEVVLQFGSADPGSIKKLFAGECRKF